mgnify:CR=1 FL=1
MTINLQDLKASGVSSAMRKKRNPAERSRVSEQSRSKKILTSNMPSLIRLTDALIAWETLDGEQVVRVINGEDIGKPVLTKKDDSPSKNFKEEINRLLSF